MNKRSLENFKFNSNEGELKVIFTSFVEIKIIEINHS